METSTFLDDFNTENPLATMAKEFDVPITIFQGCDFIVAQYSYANYEGHSFCLFEKDGVLYENYGGHCSCYGLEGQWEPQETSKEALQLRFNTDYKLTKEIKEILKSRLGLVEMEDER